jgi:O-acetyl-ADP-ribose deacetylase (regulator of RNase III)
LSNNSTGIYRFPKEVAARIAINTVLKFIQENSSVEHVIFVCFDEDNYKIYSQLLNS